MTGQHEFIIEKLFRGSVINFRTFFLEEYGEVYYRFGRKSFLFSLSYEALCEILPNHKELRKQFITFKQKTMIQNKSFPLDYIMKLPRHLSKKVKIDKKQYEKYLKVENIVKNIVIRRFVEVKKVKSKPSLKDMVAEYLK